VVQVDVFNEWLDSGPFLDLFAAHDLGDFTGSSFNTSNESMAKLSLLREY
jgi:hypothetical protein